VSDEKLERLRAMINETVVDTRALEDQVHRLARFIVGQVPHHTWANGDLWPRDLTLLEAMWQKRDGELVAKISETLSREREPE